MLLTLICFRTQTVIPRDCASSTSDRSSAVYLQSVYSIFVRLNHAENKVSCQRMLKHNKIIDLGHKSLSALLCRQSNESKNIIQPGK